jgi:transposase-like protein
MEGTIIDIMLLLPDGLFFTVSLALGAVLRARTKQEMPAGSETDQWFLRVDETYICQGGRWRYLYRAVDSSGATIDFWFSAERYPAAAKQFFKKALQAPGHFRPRVITVDGNPSYSKVIAELKQERKLGRRCHFRTSP